MKNEDVTNKANDRVVIICKMIENMRGGYTIIPEEVANGKIDDMTNEFICSNGKIYTSIEDSMDCYDPETQYYCFPKYIEELKEKFGMGLDLYGLMFAYYIVVDKVLVNVRFNNGELDIHAISWDEIESKDSDVLEAYHVTEDGTLPKEIVNAPAVIVKKQDTTRTVKMNPFSDDFDIDDLIDEMENRIVNNDDTIEDICTTVVSNLTAEFPEDTENILSIGPTGTGKSQTFKDLSDILTIPVVFCDSTQLSAAGYVGKSVEDFLKDLYFQANKNVKLANKSIFVLDEIDKLKLSQLDMKEAAQDSLLKVVEGHQFQVDLDRLATSSVSIDTTGMTVVGAGAFSDIFEKRKAGKDGSHVIGFRVADKAVPQEIDYSDINRIVTPQELKDYGFKAEFIPRFTNIFQYQELTEEGFRNMILNSRNSPLLRRIARYAKQYNCEVLYDDSFIEALIAEAIARKEGGRSLRVMTAKTFKKADREMMKPKNKALKKTIKVTDKTIKNPRDYEIKIG